MDNKKVVGWILLVVGLILIFFSLISSYRIFTGKSSLPEFFKYETTNFNINEIEKQLDIKDEEFKKALPVDFLSKIGNSVVWSLFAWILILGGGQISSLGIKLLK